MFYLKKTLSILIVIVIVLGIFIYASADRGINKTQVTINEGKITLKGTLYHPPQPPESYIVICHGNRKTGRNHPLYQELSRKLSQKNLVLSLDFRGFGESRIGKRLPEPKRDQ